MLGAHHYVNGLLKFAYLHRDLLWAIRWLRLRARRNESNTKHLSFMSIDRIVIKFRLALAICVVATLSVSSSAQQKVAPNASDSCNQKNALEILEEQIAATKTFDDQV